METLPIRSDETFSAHQYLYVALMLCSALGEAHFSENH